MVDIAVKRPILTGPKGVFRASTLLELWKQRIQVAKKVNEEEFADHEQLINYYMGNHYVDPEVPVLQDRTTVNLIFSNIKKEIPQLYFQNPSPIVNAKRPEFENNAKVAQNLLRYYTKENLNVELKRHIRLAILDAKLAPYACVKILYTPMFQPNPNVGEPIFLGDDDFGWPVFMQDDDGNFIGHGKDILVSELYYVERMSPQEILIDAECKNFPERAKWIGQIVVKSVDYLKNSPLYKNTENLGANVELNEKFLAYRSKEVRYLEEERHLFYEIYDLENDKMYALSEGEPEHFIREEEGISNPYVFLKFNEIPDRMGGIPDARQEKPLQDEINVGRSLMITHVRRAARKYYYEEDSIDDTEITKAKMPEDMTFFAVKEFAKPPRPLEAAAQDPAVFQNLMQSRLDFNEVAGSSENERGVTERRKTAHEAKFIQGHAAVRKTDKQSLVADFMKEVYGKLLQIMQKTLTIKQAIKILGPQGNFWSEVKREDIAGEFNLDVDVTEMRPQIPETEKKELSEFMFALSNLLNSIVQNPLMFQILNVQGLVKELAKPYPSLKVDNILNMAVSMDAIAKQAMQMQNKNQGQGQDQNQNQGGGGENANI